MDLDGGLWDRVVPFGNDTNTGWPAEAEGGLGYGGGTYGYGMAFETNFTTVAAGLFGSWGNDPRPVTYGFRAVESK